MPTEPEIKLLPRTHRNRLFWFLLFVFVVTLPMFIFYISGNRLNFSERTTTIVTTGGIYITTDNLEVEVYLDEERVQRPRLFRSAYYIQNIESGVHRVVVQQQGFHTWVKELSVEPYLVTEAAAFNMPILPHIRPISPLQTRTGSQVFGIKATSTELFLKATTTVPVTIVAQIATSTYQLNSEFEFVESLFVTATTSDVQPPTRVQLGLERFRFATTTEATTTETVLTEPTKTNGNMRLVQREEELFAVWDGPVNAVPYYFCVPLMASSSLALRFGDHVMRQVESQKNSTTTPLLSVGSRQCRTEIRIDRKWQDIKFFDFLPGSSDLVLLLLEDGLYVTEIDDRSWQNTQLVYSGDKLEVAVTRNAIFVKEGNTYFELITRPQNVRVGE